MHHCAASRRDLGETVHLAGIAAFRGRLAENQKMGVGGDLADHLILVLAAVGDIAIHHAAVHFDDVDDGLQIAVAVAGEVEQAGQDEMRISRSDSTRGVSILSPATMGSER